MFHKNIIFAIFLTQTSIVSLQTIPQNNELKRGLGYPEGALQEFEEIVTKNGYKCEVYDVVTSDGYILKLFRVLKGARCNNTENITPVLLMHGLALSAECFIDSGPKHALVYILSNNCYDVWVGNQRGNFHSRRHTKYNPDKDKQFWMYSYQEMGLYDTPAVVDFILNKTETATLNYIGYSQGAAAFNIMCSVKPEYNKKIGIAIMMSPTSRMLNTKSAAVKLLTRGTLFLRNPLTAAGRSEVLYRYSVSQSSLELFCALTGNIGCEFFISVMDSPHPGSITERTMNVMVGHLPAGTSIQTLSHYGQAIKSDRFLAYDHGETENMIKYGTKDPPAFNLTAVTVPMVLITGENDHTSDIKDVQWLGSQISNLLEVYVVKNPLWNHFDYTYSQYAPNSLYKKILEYLNSF